MDAHVSVEALEKFKQILTQFSKNMSVEAQKMQLHLKKTHAQLEQKHFQLKKQLQMCQDPISYERAHQQLMEFERLFAGFCHAAQECIKSFQQQELMATNREKTVVTIDRKVRVLKEYLGTRNYQKDEMHHEEFTSNHFFINGELFEDSITTSKGLIVGLLAEIEIVDESLKLNDITIYAEGSNKANVVGPREIIQWRNKIINMAKKQGFNKLILHGIRVEGSTSDKKGKIVSQIIDLTK